MRVGNVFKTGIISGMMSFCTTSCKKAPYKAVQKSNIPTELVTKLDSLSQESKKILNDTTYRFFGYDTLEINNKLINKTEDFVRGLDKKAKKNTPKVKVGEHFENLMIPKRGGGFDIIPTMKTDYEPAFKDQKVVLKSDSLYTTDGKNLFVPAEYYGRKNPKAVPYKK